MRHICQFKGKLPMGWIAVSPTTQEFIIVDCIVLGPRAFCPTDRPCLGPISQMIQEAHVGHTSRRTQNNLLIIRFFQCGRPGIACNTRHLRQLQRAQLAPPTVTHSDKASADAMNSRPDSIYNAAPSVLSHVGRNHAASVYRTVNPNMKMAFIHVPIILQDPMAKPSGI